MEQFWMNFTSYFTPDRIVCLYCLIGGYFIGSIQWAYIFGKIKGIDIRQHGSGNAGATNVLRVLGWQWGLLVLILDFVKVFAACFLAHYFVISVMAKPIDPIALTLYTGLGTVLGHDFPFYLKFKGGKGIAASCAVICCFGEWKYVIVGLIIFLLVILITRYVSLASIILMFACLFQFLFYTLMNWTYVIDEWLLDCDVILIVFVVLALIQHRKNIVRLAYGEERKFTFAVEKEDDDTEYWEEELKALEAELAEIESTDEIDEAEENILASSLDADEKERKLEEKRLSVLERKEEQKRIKAEIKALKAKGKEASKTLKKQLKNTTDNMKEKFNNLNIAEKIGIPIAVAEAEELKENKEDVLKETAAEEKKEQVEEPKTEVSEEPKTESVEATEPESDDKPKSDVKTDDEPKANIEFTSDSESNTGADDKLTPSKVIVSEPEGPSE